MLITREFNKHSGFTLVEVLVAAIVLAIGILGMTTMMLTSLKSDQSSFYRSLASTYVYDMADRLRKNRQWAINNSGYDAIDTSATPPGDPGCLTSSTGCTEAEISTVDQREWASHFSDIYAGGNFSPALPNPVGTVTRTAGSNLFTITVSWSEVDWDENNPTQKANSTETLSLNVLL
ncbi:MAG: type IV pilus modification protein PilV [Ketobacter sp.]|nr:type IV pilus modification protein PilV [Ketobacter sp.]